MDPELRTLLHKSLGIEGDDAKKITFTTLHRAYIRKVKRMHPDVAGGSFSKAAFEELQQDYERCMELLKHQYKSEGVNTDGKGKPYARYQTPYKPGRPVDPRRYINKQQYLEQINTRLGSTMVYGVANETVYTQSPGRPFINYGRIFRRGVASGIGLILGFSLVFSLGPKEDCLRLHDDRPRMNGKTPVDMAGKA